MSALFDLTGKTALVTGGAGIIGSAVCRALAEHGANVAVVDVKGEAADDLARALIADLDAKAVGIQADVSDPGSVAAMVDKACDAFGAVNALFNNAAYKSKDLKRFFQPFEDFSLDVWREVAAVNLDGVFLVAQAVGRRMREQGRGGSIIQTASIYGVVAPDQRIYEGSEYMDLAINTPAVYSATKGAVVALTKYLATYWADAGIRVNTLTPGGVESGQNDAFVKNYASRVPLGRMARAEDMAGAAVYLASDASAYVTGQNLVVDGGWTAW